MWQKTENGIIIGVSQYKNESVGSYREIHFFLSNNSMNNVDIDPETIEIRSSKKGKTKIIEPITSDDYYDKIYKNKKKDAKETVQIELEKEKRKGQPIPSKINYGLMIEVPSVIFQLESILKKADFITVRDDRSLKLLHDWGIDAKKCSDPK